MSDGKQVLGAFKHKCVKVDFVAACVGTVLSSTTREKFNQTVHTEGGSDVDIHQDSSGRVTGGSVSPPKTTVRTSSITKQEVWLRPFDGGPDVNVDREGDPIPLAESQRVVLIEAAMRDEDSEQVGGWALFVNHDARRWHALPGLTRIRNAIWRAEGKGEYTGTLVIGVAALFLGFAATVAFSKDPVAGLPFLLIPAAFVALAAWRGVKAVERARKRKESYGGALAAFDQHVGSEAVNMASRAMPDGQ